MMSKQIIREYKKGRQTNFYVRENHGVYYLEKITKACGFTIMCGNEKEVFEYIENNGFKFIGLIVK